MKRIRIAVIGCGAVTELLHLPAAMRSSSVEVVGLFDLNIDRARAMAETFNVPAAYADYRDHFNSFDACIVATPNISHAPIVVDLLAHGKHVLVEKPMALSVAECTSMIRKAKSSNALLSIGLIRRYYPNNIFIKQVIEKNVFGGLKSISIEEGGVFSWPMASDSFLKKSVVGGGVLFDIGIHILDILVWWLGSLDVVQYVDDAFPGGLESDCRIVLRKQKKNIADILLSRQRNLRNTTRLVFENAVIESGCGLDDPLRLTVDPGASCTLVGTIPAETGRPTDLIELGKREIDDFVRAAVHHLRSPVDPRSAMESVRCIEDCYKKKKSIRYQWEKV